jgi:hypothetical protein
MDLRVCMNDLSLPNTVMPPLNQWFEDCDKCFYHDWDEGGAKIFIRGAIDLPPAGLRGKRQGQGE